MPMPCRALRAMLLADTLSRHAVDTLRRHVDAATFAAAMSRRSLFCYMLMSLIAVD